MKVTPTLGLTQKDLVDIADLLSKVTGATALRKATKLRNLAKKAQEKEDACARTCDGVRVTLGSTVYMISRNDLIASYVVSAMNPQGDLHLKGSEKNGAYPFRLANANQNQGGYKFTVYGTFEGAKRASIGSITKDLAYYTAQADQQNKKLRALKALTKAKMK